MGEPVTSPRAGHHTTQNIIIVPAAGIVGSGVTPGFPVFLSVNGVGGGGKNGRSAFNLVRQHLRRTAGHGIRVRSWGRLEPHRHRCAHSGRRSDSGEHSGLVAAESHPAE